MLQWLLCRHLDHNPQEDETTGTVSQCGGLRYGYSTCFHIYTWARDRKWHKSSLIVGFIPQSTPMLLQTRPKERVSQFSSTWSLFSCWQWSYCFNVPEQGQDFWTCFLFPLFLFKDRVHLQLGRVFFLVPKKVENSKSFSLQTKCATSMLSVISIDVPKLFKALEV